MLVGNAVAWGVLLLVPVHARAILSPVTKTIAQRTITQWVDATTRDDLRRELQGSLPRYNVSSPKIGTVGVHVDGRIDALFLIENIDDAVWMLWDIACDPCARVTTASDLVRKLRRESRIRIANSVHSRWRLEWALHTVID